MKKIDKLVYCRDLILTSTNYEALLAEFVNSEGELKQSDLLGIKYAQFVAFNLRLNRLVSMSKIVGNETSDSFEDWKEGWLKTFEDLV